MSFTVLVVCATNVCRSPLAALILEHSLRAALGRHAPRVLDCGERAVPDLPACPEMLRWARNNGLPTQQLARHRSTPLDRAQIDVADLVLAADRLTRAAVLRTAPTAGHRTFTLREAASLSTGAASRAKDLAGFVAALDADRGIAGLPAVVRLRPTERPWRRLELHEHDVLDAHQEPGVTHERVRRQLVPTVERLVDAFTRVGLPA